MSDQCQAISDCDQIVRLVSGECKASVRPYQDHQTYPREVTLMVLTQYCEFLAMGFHPEIALIMHYCRNPVEYYHKNLMNRMEVEYMYRGLSY